MTARVALGTLGLAHQFTTTVYGEIVAGHARRLVLRSDGDPSLSTNGLRGVVAELRSLGLTAVDEGIFVDQSAFDEQFVPPAFEQQPDEWAAFRAPVCATALDHNRLTVRVTPNRAGAQAAVFVEPPGYADVVGSVETRAGNAVTDVRLKLAPAGDRVSLRVSGTIGEQASTYLTYRRVDDPRRLVGLALRELLREQGVTVPTQVALVAAPQAGLPALVTVRSEALPVILRSLGKDSDNFTAEMLLKAVAAKATGKGESVVGAKIALDYLTGVAHGRTGYRARQWFGLVRRQSAQHEPTCSRPR